MWILGVGEREKGEVKKMNEVDDSDDIDVIVALIFERVGGW